MLAGGGRGVSTPLLEISHAWPCIEFEHLKKGRCFLVLAAAVVDNSTTSFYGKYLIKWWLWISKCRYMPYRYSGILVTIGDWNFGFNIITRCPFFQGLTCTHLGSKLLARVSCFRLTFQFEIAKHHSCIFSWFTSGKFFQKIVNAFMFHMLCRLLLVSCLGRSRRYLRKRRLLSILAPPMVKGHQYHILVVLLYCSPWPCRSS